MEVMNKMEKEVKSEVQKILDKYVSLGKLKKWIRIFTGCMKVGRNYIHGAKKGTPDILAIREDGVHLWVETKKYNEKKEVDLRKSQEEFKNMIEDCPYDIFCKIDKSEDIHNYITLDR